MGTHVRVNVDGTAGEVVVPWPVKLTKWRDGGPCVEYYQDNKRREYRITPAEYDRLAALLTGEGEAPVRDRCDLCCFKFPCVRNPPKTATPHPDPRTPKCATCNDTGLENIGSKDPGLAGAYLVDCRDCKLARMKSDHRAPKHGQVRVSTATGDEWRDPPSVTMHPVDCLACGKRFASLSNANGQWCLACIEKRAADNRTPGQVAWEASFTSVSSMAPWGAQRPDYRADWERIAAAVLAHGRGLLYVPFTSPKEPADGRTK